MRSKPSNAGAPLIRSRHSTPLSVRWWLSRCWRAPHNFGQNCRGRSEVLGLTLRKFLAPFQRLPDDFVFVRAGELLQKSLATFLINERSERTALRTPPGVQLNRKVAVINAALKRWRIPQLLRVTDTTLASASEQASGVWGGAPASGIRGRTFLYSRLSKGSRTKVDEPRRKKYQARR